MIIRFHVFGEPCGQPVPQRLGKGGPWNRNKVQRTTTLTDARGQKIKVKEWVDHGVVNFRANTIFCATRAYRGEPLRGAITLRCTYLFERAKRLAYGPREPYLAKPDLTNITKAIEDALTDSGIWADDAIVWRQSFLKVYAASWESPGTEVEISNE